MWFRPAKLLGFAALESFGIYVLPFRDPDNVALELTAPISEAS